MLHQVKLLISVKNTLTEFNDLFKKYNIDAKLTNIYINNNDGMLDFIIIGPDRKLILNLIKTIRSEFLANNFL